MKLDLHCHVSEGSSDSKVSVAEYIEILKSKGFDGMLITDHDSYDGYRYYEQHLKDPSDNFVVLKGIEYDTYEAGHFIIVMPGNVELPILEEKGLPLRKLVNIVHTYGGILGPAHACGEPFLSIFSTGRYKRNPSIAKHFDFIEGYNSGEDAVSNHKACKIATIFNKPITGGSDSHWPECCGLTYTIIDEDVKNEDEFIAYFKAGGATFCHWEKYDGTIKENLGIWNKLLVYGFFPYNKAGALLHRRKRLAELNKIKWELRDARTHHKKVISQIEKNLQNRYSEFSEHLEDITNNELYRSMHEHRHHGSVSTLEHSVRVAATCGKVCQAFHIKNVDKCSLLKASLLHDFYLYDWHMEDNGEHKWHGFHHADKAIKNARKEFKLSKKEMRIMHSHMWPLNLSRVPKCREAWILCLTDKYVSLMETLFLRK